MKKQDDIEILRFSTAGSVDDGKSTLIGRLLYDSKTVFEDQLAAIEKTTARKQESGVNLALLTDGLKAEREQGITIDVAYRYFATPKRKFIIADTPGHEQYTRNMVTGASTAQLALILVDARKGVLDQSKRHAYISHLLKIPHVILCVNKMDLVDFEQSVFENVVNEFKEFCSEFHFSDLKAIPLSALAGDNVVEKSENMPWYQGKSLLELLETAEPEESRNYDSFRMSVQYVIRPHQDYRAYAGQIAGGLVKAGDTLLALPSGKKSKVKEIASYDGALDQAFVPQSVSIVLEDELDISRGDLLVGESDLPEQSSELFAHVAWMAEDALTVGKKYQVKIGSLSTKAMVSAIDYKVDVTTLEHLPTDSLQLNEIALVKFKFLKPLIYDSYYKNRQTGSFILIDELSNNTVGAAVIV